MKYIWDRKFTIVTDHKPLIWFFKMNDVSSHMVRLKLKLQEFDYTIVYKKGKENGNSDGLSGMFSEIEPDGAILSALSGVAEEVGMTPESEESGNNERQRRREDESETAYRDLSGKEKLEILKKTHDFPIGGHAGINRSL
jgi:hypothetical protein